MVSSAIGEFVIGESPIGGGASPSGLLVTCTPLDLIRMAAEDAGIAGDGQELSAEQFNDAFRRLNWLLAQWNHKRYLVYRLVDTSFTSTGAVNYTVGPGGNFDLTIRPDRIDSAYVRQLTAQPPNQQDYVLGAIWAREDWIRVIQKQIGNFPQWFFYDSAYPTGTVHFWPVPQASIYEMHILTKQHLARFYTQSEAIILPEEYQVALEYNLAIVLGAANRQIVSPEVKALAKNALNVIRMANVQVPRLIMPPALSVYGQYNILTDQFR